MTRIRTAAARIAVLAASASTLLLVLPAPPARAHEDRTVGTYHLAVGFGEEPAYAGFRNSVEMLLHDANDKPVNDLGDTLKVEIKSGSQTMTLSMEPDFEVGEFGTEGDYRAWFIPTLPGNYTFHLIGSIKGQKVDASFTSSDSTFDAVKDPSEVQFPDKNPTTGQLSARLDREIPRLQSGDTTLAASLRTTRDDLTTARLIAIIGLVVGALGLIAGVGMGMRKKA